MRIGDHKVWVDQDGEPMLESVALPGDVVAVRLVGEDGNVFAMIGRVLAALREADRVQDANEFRDQAFAATSYDEVLVLVTEYCEVE